MKVNKVSVPLCLIELHAMKMYWGDEVWNSWPQHLS
jgi:hypothetical protein